MAAAKLHLRAADRGAKDVHRGEEVVAHLVDAAADQLQRAQDDVGRACRSRFGFAPHRIADRAEQDRGNLALALHLDLDALLLEGARQAIDHPRAGRVHLLDAGKIEHQLFRAVALFDLAHLGIDRCDGPRRPDAGKGAA